MQDNKQVIANLKLFDYGEVQRDTIPLTLFPKGCQFRPTPGGVSDTPPGNQGRSFFRPHVAKSYFETYKSYDHMQKFRPLSQKLSKISRFEKFEFLRFCLTLTHRNCHNSLNFGDTGQGSYFGFIPLFMCSINHV